MRRSSSSSASPQGTKVVSPRSPCKVSRPSGRRRCSLPITSTYNVPLAVFSLALTHTTLHPTLGPMLVRLSSSQLTVGAALDVLIHLPSPPPGLTVFAASVYVIQTVEITSDRDGEKSHRLVRPKAYAMMEGAEGPYAAKDAAARMRKRKGSVLWEGGDKRKGQVRGEEGWRLEKMARMVSAHTVDKVQSSRASFTDLPLRLFCDVHSQPDDFHTRPTTHAGTVSSLRVSNEIVVELVYSFPPTSPGLPETVMIATLIRQPIVICSYVLSSLCLTIPSCYRTHSIHPCRHPAVAPSPTL